MNKETEQQYVGRHRRPWPAGVTKIENIYDDQGNLVDVREVPA